MDSYFGGKDGWVEEHPGFRAVFWALFATFLLCAIVLMCAYMHSNSVALGFKSGFQSERFYQGGSMNVLRTDPGFEGGDSLADKVLKNEQFRTERLLEAGRMPNSYTPGYSTTMDLSKTQDPDLATVLATQNPAVPAVVPKAPVAAGFRDRMGDKEDKFAHLAHQ